MLRILVPKPALMRNVLTIDLEDYYQVTAFACLGPSANSENQVSRIERNTERTLEILASHGCSATFFAVGAIAEKHPGLIARIARAGHELACHSFAHRQVFALGPDEFCKDTKRAKDAIENATGVCVRGYRAPSFSITKDSQWAFEILAGLGFVYDSSIFPISHLNFQMQNAPRDPFVIDTPSGSILEFPMTTLQLSGSRAPIAGGAYLRILPYWYTRWGLRHLNNFERRPGNIYLHPWELDPQQPKMRGKLTARLRHYFGLRGAEQKFNRLLGDFEFETLGELAAGLESRISAREYKALTSVRVQDLFAASD